MSYTTEHLQRQLDRIEAEARYMERARAEEKMLKHQALMVEMERQYRLTVGYPTPAYMAGISTHQLSYSDAIMARPSYMAGVDMYQLALRDPLASPADRAGVDMQRWLECSRPFGARAEEPWMRELARQMFPTAAVGLAGYSDYSAIGLFNEVERPLPLPPAPGPNPLSRLRELEERVEQLERLAQPQPDEAVDDEEEPPYSRDGVKREPGFKP